jgi:5-methylcytosine-specific restriction endonuclease McrA
MEYKEYLKTEHWKEIRSKKKIKKHHCAICGSKENLQVHHLNYDCLWKETTEDLRVLCNKCHELAHKLEPIIRKQDRDSGLTYKDLSNQKKFQSIRRAVLVHLGRMKKRNCYIDDRVINLF